MSFTVLTPHSLMISLSPVVNRGHLQMYYSAFPVTVRHLAEVSGALCYSAFLRKANCCCPYSNAIDEVKHLNLHTCMLNLQIKTFIEY